MRVLVVLSNSPISENASGMALIFLNHLKLLVDSGYSAEILMIKRKEEIDQYTEQLQSSQLPNTIQVSHLDIEYIGLEKKPVKNFIGAFTNVLNSKYLISEESFSRLRSFVQRVEPILIICEHLIPTLLVLRLGLDIPTIYCQHDWKYKLDFIKLSKTNISIRKLFNIWKDKQLENAVIKSTNGVISVSSSEAKEIKRISKKEVEVLYPIYETVDNQNSKIENKFRLVHLGGMNATSNRLGIIEFLEKIYFPVLNRFSDLKLLVIGSLSDADSKLLKYLDHPNISYKGFVPDLSTVLKPYDVHVVPWRYNTGVRTKIPLVMNYRQCLITFSNAKKSIPELKNNYNAILVNSFTEFKAELVRIYENKNVRKEISDNGKNTFTSFFTYDSQKLRFARFLEKVIFN